MTPTEFLRAVAAVLPGRPSASRTSALCQFGTKLAHDFRGDFTATLADDVGRALDEFPRYDELLAMVRRHAPAHATSREPPKERGFVRPEPTEEEQDEQDRAWWADRIERVASLTLATWRWREAMGMRATLQRSDAYPRPWALSRLNDIIASAEQAGADTDPNRVIWPRETPDYRPQRMPTLRGPSGATVPAKTAPMAHKAKPLGALAPAHLRAMREAAGIPTVGAE
jgi:hypothetical protein